MADVPKPSWRIVLRVVQTQIHLFKRVAMPLSLLVFIFVMGTIGYYILGATHAKPWTLLDCAFMTSITLTTVGYGDPLGATDFTWGRLYTMALLVAGMGATLYSVSSLTAFIVEGHLGKFFKERRMEAEIAAMSGHTIVCGAGRTGVHVIDEHLAAGARVVVVDRDASSIEKLSNGGRSFPYVVGDATAGDALKRAGIDRAGALVACLSTDPDNLFLLVTARFLHKDLRVVVKAAEHESVEKFKAAGASHVVSATFIGGMRIASEVLRPHVVGFLDTMLRATGKSRVSEAIVEPGSELAGKTMADARLDERVGLFVVAVRHQGEDDFIYSPGPEVVLSAGTALIVIGPDARVTKLEELASKDRHPHPVRMTT